MLSHIHALCVNFSRFACFEFYNFFKTENGKLMDLKKRHFFQSTNFFMLHENQAQIMGWHRWDSNYMITMVFSKFLDVHINLLHSVLLNWKIPGQIQSLTQSIFQVRRWERKWVTITDTTMKILKWVPLTAVDRKRLKTAAALISSTNSASSSKPQSRG